jgi:predicted dehydrogenase
MELSEAEVAWTSRIGSGRGDSADAVSIRRGGKEPEALTLPTLQYLDRAGSLSAFARAVKRGEEPETSGRDNLRTLALTLAALRSAQTNAPILIEAPPHPGD